MSYIHDHGKFEATRVLDILVRERALALSRREWKHRLAGHGYDLRETERGLIVTSAVAGHEICAVPEHLH